MVQVQAAGVPHPLWKAVPEGVQFKGGIGSWRPHTGFSIAGVVREVGAQVDTRRVGERVFGWVEIGSHAAIEEYVVANPDLLHPLPKHLPPRTAADLVVVGTAAMRAVHDIPEGLFGKTVLIQYAQGLLSYYLAQLARDAGGFVTVSLTNREDFAAANKYAHVVADLALSQLPEEHRAFDVVFDPHGDLDWQRARDVVREGGLYLAFAPHSTDREISGRRTRGFGRLWGVVDANVTFEDLRRLVTYVGDSRLDVVGVPYGEGDN